MRATDIYPYSNISAPVQWHARSEAEYDALLTEYFGVEAVTVSSARAGLYLILRHIGLWRTDHVLVPDFLCRSVLYVINLLGFGVQEMNARTKAIFVFHQWGYPQRMDIIMEEARKRRWHVIEDCAHAFGSTYRGQMVGSFGDASIVSLPKSFPTYVGGAVLSKKKELSAFIRETRSLPRSFGHRIFDRVSLWVARRNYLMRSPPFLATAVYIKSIHFSRIPPSALRRCPQTREEIQSATLRRRHCFRMLKQKAGEQYHPKALDEESDVVPLCVPIFFPEEKLRAAQEMLKEKNIIADILHFDVNRNMLNPRYKKCLAFPCHQYITDEELAYMCEVIGRV